jgi:tetraspanin-18
LKSIIKDYKSSAKEQDRTTLFWNQMMAQFQCCGVNSYNDFDQSPTWQANKGSRTVPEACCKLADKTLLKPIDNNCPYSPNMENSYYMVVSIRKQLLEMIFSTYISCFHVGMRASHG